MSATKTKAITTILDGEECTDLFHVTEQDVAPSWAEQKNSSAAGLLIEDVLGIDATPMEGSPCESIGFRDKESGLGYTMAYKTSVGRISAAFAHVEDIHVYRDERWDAKPDVDDMRHKLSDMLLDAYDLAIDAKFECEYGSEGDRLFASVSKHLDALMCLLQDA